MGSSQEGGLGVPTLTIVIPCFNHGHYLRDAISSAVVAGGGSIEIIIVDDGSTDKSTVQVLAELSSERFCVIRQKNGGPGKARNTGIRASSGKYILPLDADNRIRPVFIRNAIEILDNDPEVGVVYGDAEYFGEKRGRWVVGKFNLNRLMAWNYIDNCAVFRRQVWNENKGYTEDATLIGLEDWDFWLSTVESDWKFAYVPNVCFDYRVAAESLITRTYKREPAIRRLIAARHSNLYYTEFVKLFWERGSLRCLVSLLLSETRSRVNNVGHYLVNCLSKRQRRPERVKP